MSQQLVVKPQGIITEPNKVGQFPMGAFANATNLAIRSFGSVEQVEQWSVAGNLSGTPFGAGYALANRSITAFIVEIGSSQNWTIKWFWFNENTGLTTTGFAVIGSPFNSSISRYGRTGMVLLRNRLIICGSADAFAFDFIGDDDGEFVSIEGPRLCGLFQPGITTRGSQTTAEADGGVLGPNKHITACATMRVIFADGYELVSLPSMLWDFANLSTTLTQVPAFYSIDTDVLYGTANRKFKIDLYRTREQSVGYDAINNKYLPISNGSSFYLAKTVDRTGSATGITDTTLASALGEALITNLASGGAAALPCPPVPSKTAAEFRGHAFYANRLDPAEVTLLNPYFWGVIPQTAPVQLATYGIGFRVFTAGAATNASPTVTGLVNTTGVVAGQNLIYRRTDTGATVMTGQVLSKTGTTITSTVNSSYTGSVTATSEDVIEFSGTRIGAGASASAFAIGLDAFFFNVDCTAVALEPQTSIPGVGIYPGFAPTGGLRIRSRGYNPITLRATNGDNYSPTLPAISAPVLTIDPTPQLNGYAWSENNEPENCPPANYAFAGAGEIYKTIATRDCLWFFCSDGLYRLSGNGGDVANGYDWVLDPVDPKLVLHNQNCAVVHREFVYAYTNRGLVSIDSEGTVRELSDGRINPTSRDTSGKLPNRSWTVEIDNVVNDQAVWMVADTVNDEIWLRIGFFDNNPKQIWIYNTKTDTFCIRIPTLYSPREVPTLGVYNQGQQLVYTLFTGRTGIHIPNNNVSSSLRNYEELFAATQPIYGGSKTASHTLKHWQDVQFSFKTPQSAAGAVLTFRGTSGGSQIARTIPVVTGQPNAESARLGFTVWRNFPGTSNAFSFSFFIGATTGSFAPVTLEGYSVNFVDFTEQRAVR